MTTKPPTFGGEVQFAGYSDSSRSGPRITFRLADRDELAAFIGKEGKRYMLAVVEIADDETAATPAAAPKPAAPRRERMAPLCEWAVLRCAEEPFQRWAYMVALRELGLIRVKAVKARARTPADAAELLARHMVLHLCCIESRKDLDTDQEAARRLHDLVRKPYAAWLEQQQVPA